jgi:hypothetical protein
MDARIATITCTKSKTYINATQGFYWVRHVVTTLRSHSGAIHASHLLNRYRRQRTQTHNTT